MYVMELHKGDGRALTLYARAPIGEVGPVPSPAGAGGSQTSHLRWHPLRGEWIAYAAHRQDRTFLPPPGFDPLAVGRSADDATELPAGQYDIAVFDNLFPALSPAIGSVPELGVATRSAAGACEVVVYSQDATLSLHQLPLDYVQLLFEVLAHRTELHRRRGLHYVLPFENRGIEMGVTLEHPHAQIYAYPFVPPVPQRMNDLEVAHFAATGRGLLDDMLRAELVTRERVLYEGPHALAFVPVCARYPYETWIAPRRRVPFLGALNNEEREDLARAVQSVLSRYEALWERPMAYLMAWFQAPLDGKEHPESHVHAELYPPRRTRDKLKYLAGTELAGGMFVNDSLPEEKARELQSAFAKPST